MSSHPHTHLCHHYLKNIFYWYNHYCYTQLNYFQYHPECILISQVVHFTNTLLHLVATVSEVSFILCHFLLIFHALHLSGQLGPLFWRRAHILNLADCFLMVSFYLFFYSSYQILGQLEPLFQVALCMPLHSILSEYTPWGISKLQIDLFFSILLNSHPALKITILQSAWWT